MKHARILRIKIATVTACSMVLLGVISLGLRPKQPTEATTHNMLKGVAFTPPKNVSQADYLAQLKSLGGAITWSGEWSSLTSAKPAGIQLNMLAKNQGLETIDIISIGQQAAEPLPISSQTKARYFQALGDFVGKTRPQFLGLGIEVNVLARTNPAGYSQFVDLFREASQLAKQHSPATQVFTIFQLERMKGLNGGLQGGVNDSNLAQWDLLADFPSADFFAFTSYPYLVFHRVADIPAGYYEELLSRTNKRVAFSELGWPSRNVAAGWSSTPDEQVVYIDRLSEFTKAHKPLFMIWLSAYDQPVREPFTSLGLANQDGSKKPSWATWATLK